MKVMFLRKILWRGYKSPQKQQVSCFNLSNQIIIGISLEKIFFKKIFRDGFFVFVLAVVLLFGAMSESWADTCSWSGYWYYCYDAKGNKTSDRYCGVSISDGKCSSYLYGHDYTYDKNGYRTSYRYCNGSSNFDSDGNCSSYSGRGDYIYDQNGYQTSYRYCNGSNMGSDGKCTSYSEGRDYTYDQNGYQTSYRHCNGSNMGSDGKCSSYSFGSDYTYDANGNKAGETYVSCSGNTCYMDVHSCNHGSCSLTNQYTGLAYSPDGKLCNTANPPVCYDFDLDSGATHCSINDTNESCLVCKDGYGLKNGKCQYCGAVAQSCHWDEDGSKVADSCYNGYILGGGQCYKCNSPAATCEWNGSKFVATSCVGDYALVGGSCHQASCEPVGDLTYCYSGMDECALYVLDENQKTLSKMSCGNSGCRGSGPKTDCTTEVYDENGNVVAVYDDDNEPVAAYDYDDKGDVIAEYDDQCAIERCADGYNERGDSCVVDCGPGYRNMGGWCNKIQWTPAEAAAVLTDDNNNSVTITFKK